MFVKLKGTLDDGVEIDGLFLRRSRSREFQQVLDDAGSAASLTVGEVELTLHGFVEAFALADQFRNAKNGGEGIIELMRDAGKHLAHGCKFFRLDQLLLETLQVGNVAAREDNSFDFVPFVEQGAEIEKNTAPIAILMAHANFH